METAQSGIVASRIHAMPACAGRLLLLFTALLLCVTHSDAQSYAANSGRTQEASSEQIPGDLLRREVVFYGSEMRQPMPQAGPGYMHNGPKVVLINGVTQSGGDLLAYMVKRTRTATLLGTRTNGAMAGAGGLYIPFADGGNSLVPTVGFYSANGTWGGEGFGVSPDIEVPDDPAARFDKADPQLDAAIRVLLDKMRQHPSQRPRTPF
jgi:tricorn protease